MTNPAKVTCLHCTAQLKPKFASNDIPACKRRAAEQSRRDRTHPQ